MDRIGAPVGSAVPEVARPKEVIKFINSSIEVVIALGKKISANFVKRKITSQITVPRSK
jgi:hypothetical protein